jgi:hypothetical protein
MIKKTNKKKIMNNNILNDYNLTDCGYIIACGIILGFSLYYLIRSNNTAIPTTNTAIPTNNTAIPTNNMQPLTYEEIETIINEEGLFQPISDANIDDFITDSDFDTDIGSDSQGTFDSISTSDIESILEDQDLFFMPNVDFDVCPIEELKFFELSSLYQREILEHEITDEDIVEFLSWFSKEDLATNWINDVFLFIISLL